MVQLPNEIIANIVPHLSEQHTDGGDDEGSGDSQYHTLAQYAVVSRSWQECVEAETFAHITLTPARAASPLAAQALRPSRMHRFVRSVDVDVVLPPYRVNARRRQESFERHRTNNRAFTGFIRNVFALLSSRSPGSEQQLEQGFDPEAYRPKIKLSMKASCVSDTEDLEERQNRQRSTGDIFEARYESSYLFFSSASGNTARVEAKALPELPCISEFHVQSTQGCGRRLIAPRMLCLLASRMPCLRGVNWDLCDNERRHLRLRKWLRGEFAKALEKLPPSLESFDLVYEREPPMNHSYQPPSILDETDRHGDKLSVALHKLSLRLGHFSVFGDFGLEVLWPLEKGTRKHNDHPRWPSMREYVIGLGAIAPSGEWRFQRPTDSSDNEHRDEGSMQLYEASDAAPGDDKEDPFRRELDKDAADQLLLAAARAVTCMPKLTTMVLTIIVATESGQLFVDYANSTSGSARELELCFESRPIYHPDEEVLRLWREMARLNFGLELKVVIEDCQSW